MDDNRPPEPIVQALRAAKGQPPVSGANWVPPSAEEILDLGIVRLKSLHPVEVLSRALVEAVDWDVRMLAAKALGETNDHRAIDPLVAALRDPDSSVRATAAEALGRLGNPASTDALTKLLRDPSRRVRSRTRKALRAVARQR